MQRLFSAKQTIRNVIHTTMGTRQRQSGLLFTVCLLALAGLDRVEASEDVKAWQKTIVELEKLVFDPVLTADEVDRLLGELKLEDKRAAAAKRLCEQGRGHIERILVFAHDCPDIEARQACRRCGRGPRFSLPHHGTGETTRESVS